MDKVNGKVVGCLFYMFIFSIIGAFLLCAALLCSGMSFVLFCVFVVAIGLLPKKSYILAVIVVLFILISITIPGVGSHSELRAISKCETNLRYIQAGVAAYAIENYGKFPPDLGTLFEKGYIEPENLKCPSDISDSKVSYCYRGDDMDDSCSSSMIVAYEKCYFHWNDVRSVVFVDGHTKYYDAVELQELVDRDNEIRKELNLEVKPLTLEDYKKPFKLNRQMVGLCIFAGAVLMSIVLHKKTTGEKCRQDSHQ